RRAMGKKKKEVLDKEFEPFSAGMRERGYSDAAIKTLWDVLVPFSDYAFNKAHSAAYGLVSYWTAYLKAHYACEYMAALLTSTRDDKDKSALYLNECRRKRLTVLPPDVNASAATFTPVGDDIRFGLASVRNVVHQAHARVPDQYARVRLPRQHRARPAGGARAGSGRRHRGQAQGGRGSVRPVRRSRQGQLRRRRVHRGDPRPAGVGQEAEARLR